MGAGSLTLLGSSTYSGGTNVSAGTLVIGSATAFPNNGTNGTALTVGTGATFQIAQHLNAGNGGMSTVPLVNSLTNNVVIDITNNAMQFPGIGLNTIYPEVLAAHNSNGTWATSGSGLITSSTVTGLTSVGVGTVNGVSEVKATYYGDANLDGSVNSADYTIVDSSFLSEQGGGANVTGWQNGDFNYDNVVNGSDYTLIDNAFNTQGGQLLAQVATETAQIAGGGTASAVPEPASLGLIGFGALGLLGRRSRRRR
jgi:autotransporter-associated beta strand protein